MDGVPDNNLCARCGANLTDGICEYCGWTNGNKKPEEIPDRTLTLSGVLGVLTVTKETSTFKPKIGAASILANKEITEISLAQAPIHGTGELSFVTAAGITKKVTFLYPQNPNMEEIASYLLHVVPDAKFVTATPTADFATEQVPVMKNILCPKCKQNAGQILGVSRKMSIWKIVVGVILILISFGVTDWQGEIIMHLVFIVVGLVFLFFGIKGKKKSNCLCSSCGNRFRV